MATKKTTPCGKPDCGGGGSPVCCEKRIDTSCVYYHSCVTTPSKLTCLSIKNGASMESILETIDKQFCISIPKSSTWNLPCLRNKYHYVVTDFKSFAEAVDDRICKLEGEITTNLINNNSFIDQITNKILNNNSFINDLINRITSNQNFINNVTNIIKNNCCEKPTCDLSISVGTPSCTQTPICNPVTSVTITGNSTVNQNQTITYSASATNATGYDWNVTGGSITAGQNTASITVQWGTGTTGSVRVTATGCNSSSVQATKAVTLTPVNTCTTASNVSITGITPITSTQQTTYTYSGYGDVSAYQWQVQGGSIQGSSTGSSITVLWGAAGNGLVSLTVTTCNGTQIPVTKNITINPVNTCTAVSLHDISGNGTVLGGTNQFYSVTPATGSTPITYAWTVSGGVFINQPQSTDTSVNITWNNAAGDGYVSVTATNCANQPVTKTLAVIRTDNTITYTCGNTISGMYAPSNQYTYPTYTLDLSSRIGSNVSLNYAVNDRPNLFRLLENGTLKADSGWKGIATYPGPWGVSLSTQNTGVLTFVPVQGATYTLQVLAGNADTTPGIVALQDAFEVTITCTSIDITSATPTGNTNQFTVTTTGDTPVRWELTDSENTIVASGNI